MVTCKEVATELSSGIRDKRRLVRRLQVALHLVMCSACRAFARQVAWLDRSARRSGGALEQDFPAGLEERIQERLTRSKK